METRYKDVAEKYMQLEKALDSHRNGGGDDTQEPDAKKLRE